MAGERWATPPGWKRAKVSDVCRLQNGHGFRPQDWTDAGLPIIRIQNLNGNPNFNHYAGPVDEQWLVPPGQMLFAWAGTKGVSFGPTVWRGPTGVLNQHIFKVFPRAGVDPDWLHLALRHVTERIEARAHGFKATLVHVKKSEIDNHDILLPPLAEQQRIALLISTWERAIGNAQSLVSNADRQKTALIQQLVAGKRRLPGFAEEWQEIKFSQIFERVRRKNAGLNRNVLTISAQDGLVSQTDYFNKSVSGQDLSGYTLVRRGEFAYNRSYSDGYPMGAIKALKLYDEGVVSSLYICFAVASGRVVPEFLEHYFDGGLFARQLTVIAKEGARNHGLLNVSVGELFGTSLKLPAKTEQAAIADVIDTAGGEIRARTEQLDALRKERSALMRRLLTGERRLLLAGSEAA